MVLVRYHELHDIERGSAGFEGGDPDGEAVAEGGLARRPPLRREGVRDVARPSVESYRPSHLQALSPQRRTCDLSSGSVIVLVGERAWSEVPFKKGE